MDQRKNSILKDLDRRTFIQAAAVTPFAISGTASGKKNDNLTKEVSDGYFAALPETKAERNEAVVSCANALCSARKSVSKEVIGALIETGSSANVVTRRLQFGVRILNEYNLTDKIDEAMIAEGRKDLSSYTRYLPLVGSFNNLCRVACRVNTPDPNPESIKNFIFAVAAFGLEVALWTIGTPYKMAWRGTRFIANRTFLRFARYGCRGCIALLMSEVHWAIRGSIYGEVVTESNAEFVWNQIKTLRSEAEDLNYDVDLDFTYSEIQRLVGESESVGGGGIVVAEREGPIESLIPDISIPDISIDLPTLSDLLK